MRRLLLIAALLFPLILGSCSGPTVKAETGPYKSWVDWTNPKDGLVYKVPKMFTIAERYWSVIPSNYQEIIEADMEDVLRNQKGRPPTKP